MESSILASPSVCHFFFFNDTATTEIYTLSLHDALPILPTASSWKRSTCPKGQLMFALVAMISAQCSSLHAPRSTAFE